MPINPQRLLTKTLCLKARVNNNNRLSIPSLPNLFVCVTCCEIVFLVPTYDTGWGGTVSPGRYFNAGQA